MENRNIAQGISIRTLRREIRRCGIELADIKSAATVRIPAGAARSGKVCNTQGSTPPDRMPSTEAHSIYADRMLRLGERSLYDEVVKNLRNDYAAITGAHSLHLELAAVYYVKLVRAQTDGDWEQAERFDRSERIESCEKEAGVTAWAQDQGCSGGMDDCSVSSGSHNAGRYIYHSDHSVPPTVSWDNYCYAQELIDRYGKY